MVTKYQSLLLPFITVLTCFPASAPCNYVIFQFIEELSLNWSILFLYTLSWTNKKIGNNPHLGSSLYYFADWSPKTGSRWFWFRYKIGLSMVLCYQNCSNLLWEKNVLVIEKNFWNSRLKAKNFQNLWDHSNNLFKQWKVRTIFGNRIFFNLFLEVSHI